MKKLLLLLTIAFNVNLSNAQTLITYGTNTVSKDEFLRAYNKNKTPVDDKEKSLRDYLELYSNFKLKVKAAKDLHVDTLAQLKADIENFRRQIDENYLSNEKEMDALVDQAFIRSQQDLHVLHFSIPVSVEAVDSMKAYDGIQAIYNGLKSGNTNYTILAESGAAKYADLGYVTVFSLPYQYENLVYGLKPGEIGKPYRSKSAWHIFIVKDQRKSAGKWKVAQILLTYPPNPDLPTKNAAQKLADSLYNLTQHGADFSTLAKTFSNDKLTYLSGGELPEFSSGKYDNSFEEEVFKLKKDSDVTRPFTTAFGIHIVKRLSFTPTPSDKQDATYRSELKQKVMQDSRIGEAKEKFSKEIISRIGFKKNPAITDEELFRYVDSLKNHDEDTGYIRSLPLSNKTVISFTKGSLKGADWLKFIKDYKGNPEQYKGETNKALWDKYVTVSSLEYYRNHLEEYSPDFKFQMQEFREGNMLFEIMEKNVWTRAGTDSTGLLQYYNAHKENYKWAESADVLIVNAASENLASEAMADLKTGKEWKTMVEAKNNEVQVDSSRYELSQINGSNNAFPAGADAYSSISKNPDGTATFVKYLKSYPANQQRNFEEARGLVINDYQNVLEQKWVAELHKKYPVKINEPLVKTMLK